MNLYLNNSEHKIRIWSMFTFEYTKNVNIISIEKKLLLFTGEKSDFVSLILISILNIEKDISISEVATLP